MKFPVGLQLYSVRDALEADYEGTLKAVSEMGYEAVEFACGLYGHTPEEVRALCDKYHLVPLSTHVPIEELFADPEGVMATYQKIGCKYLVIPYIGREFFCCNERWPDLIDLAARLGKLGKKYDLTVCYHNHNFEFDNKLGDEYMLDAIYRLVPADLLQTQLDTCWVNVGGEDPAAYVRKYAGRCPTVHLKDFVGKKSEHMFALIGINDDAEKKAAANKEFTLMPCGYGVQNFPEILKACEDAGAEWIIIEQDRPSMDKSSMECAKMSIDYIKTINK